MTVIRIREKNKDADSWNAKVIFDGGEEYDILIHDPFTDAEEQQLEWYFEDYLRFPFIEQVKANTTAESITTYGEALFQQVFANPDVYSLYRDCLREGLEHLLVEIVGHSEFHRLHWEALKDPKFAHPLSPQATIVRRNIRPLPLHITPRPSPTINVLLVTARPFGKRDVGYRTISRPLIEGLRQANLPVRVDLVRPGTFQALENHLREATNSHGVGYYHLVHFDVHGMVCSYQRYQQLEKELQQRANPYQYAPYGRPEVTPYDGRAAFLFLQGEADGTAEPIQAQAIADLLQRHQVPIAILNACQSGKETGDRESSLGNLLVQAGVQFVLAMGYSVTVSAAEVMMRTFYSGLFAQDDLPKAVRNARQELFNRKGRRVYYNQIIDLEDWVLPVVYQNQLPRLSLRQFTPDESKAYYQRDAERYPAPKTNYRFVGRDLDILQIEQRLLIRRNVLLVQGMGGAGKTTLLHYLGYWWQTTGFIEQVFYFGYDEQAWTRQQILVRIAQKLLPDPIEYTTQFQSLPTLDAQQAMLTRLLRSKRHLLILDNLESTTGAALSIQHTLPVEEQQALHSLLTDLVDGQTLVLLGSRGSEGWIATNTFNEHIYPLNGLDSEAASQLADLILKRYHREHYRDSRDLDQLVKVLDGFPLALEVVLANLTQQTPKEVLAALEAGDVTLDSGKGHSKTENIVRCIDYSHRNLAPPVQQLLACLAPFTSVIWQDMLDRYTAALKQQPSLKDLPFERWPEVIEQAKNWGLLRADEQQPQFLKMQPLLPYFLRAHLAAPEQRAMQTDVETAFREYYLKMSALLLSLLSSKDPEERRAGQVLTNLEYDNLVTALKLAVTTHVSTYTLYGTLTSYLRALQDQRRGLELGQFVLDHLQAYSQEELQGPFGTELVSLLLDIANWRLKLKEYTESEALYHRCLQVLDTIEQRNEPEQQISKAGIYHNLGIVAEEQRQWEQAQKYYQQALQIFIDFNERSEQAATYDQLGIVAQQQRQWEQAQAYYQQALQIKIDINDRHSQAITYHNLGIIAGERRQWEQAQKYYQQALQINIDFNDLYEQASNYHELGVVAGERRQWEQSQAYYQQALQIKIDINDRYRQASTYRQLGQVAEGRQQWEQAQAYYQQALQIFIDFNDRYEEAATYRQLGWVARERQQWEQAQKYYQQALPIFIDINDHYEQAVTYHNLGRISQQQRQWEQAQAYYQQALQIFIDFNDNHSQARIYHQLGRVAEGRQQWEQAGDFYLQALQLFVPYNDQNSSWMALFRLAQIWKETDKTDLPTKIASIVNMQPQEVEQLLRQFRKSDDQGS